LLLADKKNKIGVKSKILKKLKLSLTNQELVEIANSGICPPRHPHATIVQRIMEFRNRDWHISFSYVARDANCIAHSLVGIGVRQLYSICIWDSPLPSLNNILRRDSVN